MKKIILFVALLSCTMLKAQQTTVTDTKAPIIAFEKDTIDYGTIPHNADGCRFFKFTNTGKTPLLIREAHGSCGCLVATWPQYPIQPGQSDKITVHYATSRVGVFVKSITVISNANPATHTLIIRGKVLPDPVESTATGK